MYLIILEQATYPCKMSEKKRFSYTTSFKLKVIEYAKEHGNHAAERCFGPPPNRVTIREWRQQEDALRGMPREKRAARGKSAKWPNLEKRLTNWIMTQREGGIAVSTKMIMHQGQVISDEMMKNKETEETADFRATHSWCFRFMKRNNLAMRTRTKLAQKMPNAYEDKILQFHSYVINLRKTTNFELGQIANMDEVPLTFDVPSNRTVNEKGAKTVSIKTSGHEKTHYTVVLACCADGTKLPPMLIFKRKTLPKEKLPSGVFVHVQDKGWMNQEGMKLWFGKIWSRRPGGLLKKPALLVFDQFRAHLTEETKKLVQEARTQLAVIPGGLTSQLQPLDVSINKPFKNLMREEWSKWMQEADSHLTPTGKVRKPTINEVCHWVIHSWAGVKKEVVVKSFLKCGISNALDGTEDEEVYAYGDSSDEEELDEVTARIERSDIEDESEEEFYGFYDD